MELLFQNTFHIVSHGNLAYFVFDLCLEGLQTNPINGGIHLDNLNNMAVMLLCTRL